MGNQKVKQSPSKIQLLLNESYHNLHLHLTRKELTTFNLKLTDAETYFNTTFTFFLYFNSKIFNENSSILYDNFNTKVEEYCKEISTKPFTILLEFDDESDTILFGNKIEFESLFNIIFERLEIPLITCIDLTSCQLPYITTFITQLYENSALYKSNRQFDCIHFLLPNTDYFIKNMTTLTYASCKKDNGSNGMFNVVNKEMMSLLLLHAKSKKFLQFKKDNPLGHDYYYKTIEHIAPLACLIVSYVNILNDEDCIAKMLSSISIATSNCPRNVFCFFVNKKWEFPTVEEFAMVIERIMERVCSKGNKLKEITVKFHRIVNGFNGNGYGDSMMKVVRKYAIKNEGKFTFAYNEVLVAENGKDERQCSAMTYTCEKIGEEERKGITMSVMLALKKRFDGRLKENVLKNIMEMNGYWKVKEQKKASAEMMKRHEFKRRLLFEGHALF